jgi:hypothetical protein
MPARVSSSMTSSGGSGVAISTSPIGRPISVSRPQPPTKRAGRRAASAARTARAAGPVAQAGGVMRRAGASPALSAGPRRG